MSREKFGVALIGVFACVLFEACAGSSSESPWPVEPSEVDRGPAGEQPKEGLDVRKVPNRYDAGTDTYGGSGGGRAEPPKGNGLEESGAVP